MLDEVDEVRIFVAGPSRLVVARQWHVAASHLPGIRVSSTVHRTAHHVDVVGPVVVAVAVLAPIHGGRWLQQLSMYDYV